MENVIEKAKPQGKKYKFKVRNEAFETENQFITGREVFTGGPPPNRGFCCRC